MENFQINVLDLIVFGVLALSCIVAVIRGFVRETLSIVAWVGAAAVTYYTLPLGTAFASDYIDSELASQITAGIAIFLGSILLFSLAGGYISKLVQKNDLGTIDRTLGFAFGFARGSLILVFSWLIFTFLFKPEDYPDFVAEAKTLPILEDSAALAARYIPFEMAGDFLQEQDRAGTGSTGPLELSIDLSLTPAQDLEKLEQTLRGTIPGNTGANEPDYNQEQREGLDTLVEESQ